MAFTMWGQRKALGRRYSVDPALLEEAARLEKEYALQPGREARALQAEQFAKSLAQSESQFGRNLAFNQEQSTYNRAMQQEQLDAQSKSSMVGTGTNLIQNAAMMRMMTKGAGEPFFGKTVSGYTDKLFGGGAAPTTEGGMATATPKAGAVIDPAMVDAAAGAGAAGGAAAGEGYALAGAAAPEEFFAGTGAVAGEAGATLGGAGTAALAAAPYAAAGYIGAKLGGKLITDTFGEHTFAGRLGKTIQDPLQGVGRSLVNEFMPEGSAKNVATTVMDVLNPIGWAFSQLGCIIVTACTDPHSPEVEIAREYRDRFMSPDQLRGYYMIAEAVMPWVIRHKTFVKKHFVDRLVEYGRYHLGYSEKVPCRASSCVTRGFLMLCGFAGRRKRVFVRCNGEAV
jgi:Tfp pilus assembly protein PilE